MTSVATDTRASPRPHPLPASALEALDEASTRRIHWALRVGAAACFIGHGAFGIITKAAWVPYFAVAGIPSDMAWTLMPVVGTIDVVMGIAVLLSPRPVVLLYMTAWALWTALLRPLAGESGFETMERAGNYGVPLALLLILGWPRSWRGWLRGDGTPADGRTIMRVLQWTTAILLFGHGALAAVTEKPLFAEHYAVLGMPASIAPLVGYAEMLVASIVIVRPSVVLLTGIAVWKLVTEALFPIGGAPIWEFIERGGSYAAPIALALLFTHRARSRDTLRGRST
jgi:hypothetical protein